jgi:hypothetical protein
MLGFIIIIVALVGAAVGGSPKADETGGKEELNIFDWPTKTSELKHLNGKLDENDDETIFFNVTQNYVFKVTITLNWLDEAPATGPGRYQNQPDSFNFTVYTPWKEIISSIDAENEIGEAGIITETIMVPEDGIKSSEALGEWKVVIHCINCGEQKPQISIFDFRTIEDTGNDWALSYQYEFYTNN